jgi:hypothetical protein
VKSLRKQIDRLNPPKLIPVLGKRGKVPRQGSRIARDVENSFSAKGGQVGFDALRTDARRVEDNLGELFPASP